MKTFEFKGRRYGKGVVKHRSTTRETVSLGPVIPGPRKWKIKPSQWLPGKFVVLRFSTSGKKWKVYGWSMFESIAEAMAAIAQFERLRALKEWGDSVGIKGN